MVKLFLLLEVLLPLILFVSDRVHLCLYFELRLSKGVLLILTVIIDYEEYKLSVDLDYFLVLFVVTQQILQISLRLIIALLFLQVQQPTQLTHFHTISSCTTAHNFLDLLNQIQSLPSHLSTLVTTFVFHGR